MINLPFEILSVICDELGHRHDFQTLFACALTCKVLGRTAVRRLYSIYLPPPKCSAFPYRIFDNYCRHHFNKEEILWKSIVLSTTGKTAFPYCLFIRSLDLNYLNGNFSPREELLDYCNSQREKPRSFSPDHPQNSTDHDESIELIGDILISHMSEAAKKLGTEPSLECLMWHNKNGALTRWTRQLPKLKVLQISDSFTSNAEELAVSISKHCSGFNVLILDPCCHEGPKQSFSIFFKGLEKNTLRELHIYDLSAYDNESLYSLRYHAESLSKLSFGPLYSTHIKKLQFFCVCKRLTSVRLPFEYEMFKNLFGREKTDNFSYEAMVNWICSCDGLREISVGALNDGTVILTKVCSNDRVRLQKLEIINVDFRYCNEFFTALSTQITLEYLNLEGYPSGYYHDDIHSCLSLLGALTNLRCLVIDPNRCSCQMKTIVNLASHLSQLEEFAFRCPDANDNLWPALTNLRYLRALTMKDTSQVSHDGVLAYVNALHATNKGLRLKLLIYEFVPGVCQTEEQILVIGNALRAKAGGCFEIEKYCDEWI